MESVVASTEKKNNFKQKRERAPIIERKTFKEGTRKTLGAAYMLYVCM